MSDDQGEISPTRIYPITFCQQGKLQAIPVPLVRLSLCGLIEVEVLTEVVSSDSPQGRYEVLSPQALRGRGAVPALMLLKLLASCPQRFATCDWLSEQMGREMDAGALVRLDTIASALRSMLCRLKAEERTSVDVLRLLLVTYLRNGRSSGPGYQLAPYPLIWVDSDALGDQVEHGALMERMSEPMLALPFWQRAVELGSRGDYLCDEPHSAWAKVKREQVAGYLRQSVHALHRLLLAERGEASREAVILLLRTYWQTHQTDEDALRPLMELLGEQERFGEVDAYYQQCVAALKQEEAEREPASQTRDVHEFVRLKHLSRSSRPTPSSSLQDVYRHDFLSIPQQHIVQNPLLLPLPGDATHAVLGFPVSSQWPEATTENVIFDDTARLGMMLSQMIALIQQWYGMAPFCQQLQDQLDQKIKELEMLKPQLSPDAPQLSRRSFLMALAALPTMMCAAKKQSHKMTIQIEEFLPQCAASITACWHLSGGSHLEMISPIIDSYVPVLMHILKSAPPYRGVVAQLLAQCSVLKAILAWHVEGLESAERLSLQALNYSEIGQNTNLRLTALNQQALLAYYAKDFQKALRKSEEAHATLQMVSQEHIYPIVQGRVLMYLAALQAQNGRNGSQQTLEHAHNAFAFQRSMVESVPLYADCGDASLLLWDGLTHFHLSLQQPSSQEAARTSLNVFGQCTPHIDIPERFRLECVTNRIRTAIRCSELEEALVCFEAGRQGVRALESKQRQAELVFAFQEMRAKWPREKRVQDLQFV